MEGKSVNVSEKGPDYPNEGENPILKEKGE